MAAQEAGVWLGGQYTGLSTERFVSSDPGLAPSGGVFLNHFVSDRLLLGLGIDYSAPTWAFVLPDSDPNSNPGPGVPAPTLSAHLLTLAPTLGAEIPLGGLRARVQAGPVAGQRFAETVRFRSSANPDEEVTRQGSSVLSGLLYGGTVGLTFVVPYQEAFVRDLRLGVSGSHLRSENGPSLTDVRVRLGANLRLPRGTRKPRGR